MGCVRRLAIGRVLMRINRSARTYQQISCWRNVCAGRFISDYLYFFALLSLFLTRINYMLVISSIWIVTIYLFSSWHYAMVPFRLKIYVSNVLVWVESEKPSNQDMKRGEKTTRTTTIATNNNTSNNNTALHINFPLFSRGLNAIWCLPIEILFCPWTKIFGHSHTNRIPLCAEAQADSLTQ